MYDSKIINHINPEQDLYLCNIIKNIKLCVPLKITVIQKNILSFFIRNNIRVSRDPMIISLYNRLEVIFLDYDNTNNTFIISSPEFQTYGASVNHIRMVVFNTCYTIPKKVVDDMRSMTNIYEIERKFGDSVEKTIWIKTLLDKEDKLKKK